MKVLLQAKKQGMNPQALQEKPEVPWYYVDIYNHFQVLSFSRSRSQAGPNPIDIITILEYNNQIAKMERPADFLYLIQTLDSIFLTPKNEGVNDDRNKNNLRK